MITHKELEQYILGLGDAVFLDYPFGKDVAVYKVKDYTNTAAETAGKMFVLIQEQSDPLQISVKCDPQLAVILREKYETVLPGYHLNKKHWNTIICTGQVSDEELKSFIVHSYELVR